MAWGGEAIVSRMLPHEGRWSMGEREERGEGRDEGGEGRKHHTLTF